MATHMPDASCPSPTGPRQGSASQRGSRPGPQNGLPISAPPSCPSPTDFRNPLSLCLRADRTRGAGCREQAPQRLWQKPGCPNACPGAESTAPGKHAGRGPASRGRTHAGLCRLTSRPPPPVIASSRCRGDRGLQDRRRQPAGPCSRLSSQPPGGVRAGTVTSTPQVGKLGLGNMLAVWSCGRPISGGKRPGTRLWLHRAACCMGWQPCACAHTHAHTDTPAGTREHRHKCTQIDTHTYTPLCARRLYWNIIKKKVRLNNIRSALTLCLNVSSKHTVSVLIKTGEQCSVPSLLSSVPCRREREYSSRTVMSD